MSRSTRISGFFLMVAGIALPIIIIDYISIMAGAGGAASPLERAAFGKSVYHDAAQGWVFEVIAMGLFAAAGLTLTDRDSRIGWALAGVGALVTTPMYGVMLGGYGEVFSRESLDAELYLALRGVAARVFFAGQGLTMAGLALAFALESFSPQRVVPSWLTIIGGAASGFAGLIFLLVHFGVMDDFTVGGPFGLVAFLVAAVVGARLAFKRS